MNTSEIKRKYAVFVFDKYVIRWWQVRGSDLSWKEFLATGPCLILVEDPAALVYGFSMGECDLYFHFFGVILNFNISW